MVQPAFLTAGDSIVILSTARKISKAEVLPAVSFFKSIGLQVKLGSTIGAEHHQYAGDDAFRAAELQHYLDDDSCKAIICARGGYGTIRLLDALDFTKFCNQPKWIVGYSDVTVLHAHINQKLKVQTIHGTMPINFATNTTQSLESLRCSLFGMPSAIKAPSHQLNIQGTATAPIVGGNLSILYSILGTKSGLDTTGKILFIEDLDEYLYHLDRMMQALDRAGKLSSLAGLVVGGMTDMNDNTVPFGKNAEEIINEYASKYEYPVAYNFPAGHLLNNEAIVLGATYSLAVTDQSAVLTSC